MNLRKSRREILASEDTEKVREVIVDWRDRRLLDVIDRQWRENRDSEICIGVLFGAAHMRAVIRHLMDVHGYRIAKAEWTTVFTL